MRREDKPRGDLPARTYLQVMKAFQAGEISETSAIYHLGKIGYTYKEIEEIIKVWKEFMKNDNE